MKTIQHIKAVRLLKLKIELLKQLTIQDNKPTGLSN